MRMLKIILSISLILLFAAAASAKIVFSSARNGNSDIYVMDDDGNNITQITNNPFSERKPRWSPNGKQIAFLRDTTPLDHKGNPNVFMMNPNGTNVRQVTDYDGSIWDFSLSPDGKKVLFSKATIGMTLVDLDSGEVQEITRSHVIHFDWSPDGKQIVYVNDDHQFVEKNLWIVDANGDNQHAWTQPDPEKGTMDHLHPRWSPDGKQMLYTESDTIVKIKKGEQGNLGISIRTAGTFRYIIRNIDDGSTQILEIPEDWMPNSVAWMNGNRSVLFSAYKYEMQRGLPYEVKIYKCDISSGEITQLTNGSSARWISDDVFSVSPAGKYPVRWGELKKAYSD